MNKLIHLLSVSLGMVWLTWAMAECNPKLEPTFNRQAVKILDEGVVLDTTTGLMWMRCSLGYEWQKNNCVQHPSNKAQYTWPQALLAAKNSGVVAGYSDWRLPNKNELGSLVDFACFQPALDTHFFPDTQPGPYWTNSPNAYTELRAWAINFANGEHITSAREDVLNVRLVRDPKP